MKKLILLVALTATMLTTASANFSFMGDMMRDMTDAAKEMRTEATDGMKEMKTDTIDAVKEMKTEGIDAAKDMKSEGIDGVKEMKDDLNSTKLNTISKSKKEKD